MKTILTRANTLLQLVSLFACITTIVLVAVPTEASTKLVAEAAPIPRSPSDIALVSARASLVTTSLEAPPLPVAALPIPPCEWTDEARKQLTRMVLIESSSGRDTSAISWTMARRWIAIARHRGETFAEYVVKTSRPLRRYEQQRARGLDSNEAISVAGLTEHQAEVVEGGSPNRVEVAEMLDRWASGRVPDPCEGRSFMWASPWFAHSNTPVSCGDTANDFYELPARTHAIFSARLDDFDVTRASCDPGRP